MKLLPNPLVYYVRHGNETDIEPRSGWYFSKLLEDDREQIRGPFTSKQDAYEAAEEDDQ